MDRPFINGIKQDRYFDHLRPAGAAQSLYQRLFIRSDRWRYGDLYGLCYLSQYRKKLEPFKQYQHREGRAATGKILYIIGDSFLADKVLNGAFPDFDDVVFLDRRFPLGHVAIDPHRQNYLLLEFAERNLNDFQFGKTDQDPWTATPAVPAAGDMQPSLPERVANVIFNKDLSRNLELLLFDDSAATPVKESKAWLNYKLFRRTAPEVAVSTDMSRLFLAQSVDTASRQSAFRPLPGREVDQIVLGLSQSAGFYRSVGFRQVYLAIIPNAVSVYDQNRSTYNHLLEKVEKKVSLPIISVYRAYQDSPLNLYYRSDAHWNPSGLDLWVNQCNRCFHLNP